MRPDNVRLGVLAVVTLFVFPHSTLAQTTTSTDAAIAELRQLLADQRAALDRQARIIEEQGRTLAALQQRVEGKNASPEEHREPEVPVTTTAAAAVEAQASVAQQPTSRTAAAPTPEAHFGRLMKGFALSVHREPLIPAGAPLDFVPTAEKK